MLTIGSLFSGIGGLELGLEWAGLGPVKWQVEKDPFCRSVLERHWPGVKRYEDVCDVGAAELEPVDLICGGFPCQDLSSAGKGAGLAGSRSGLWREFARIVGALRPGWVVCENVASGARRWVDAVVSDLGQQGYEVLPVPLSAQDVGAPHIRRRVFLVAHSVREPLRQQQGRGSRANGEGAALPRLPGEAGDAANANRNRQPTQSVDEQVGWLSAPTEDGGREWRPPVSAVCGVDDGIPDRFHGGLGQRGDRTRALGNAVVPQCAEVIGWAVREMVPGWEL